jgi:Putative F0F1-ATPase subunit Ca2+/Mg2+ transporter
MSQPTPETPGGEGPKKSVSDLPGLAAFATMGTTIALSEAAGVGAGIWLDNVWRVAPWMLFLGVVLGTAAAVVLVIKQVRRFL